MIGEGDNQKIETFGKSEGSQLDKSVNEIVENRNLNGDTIGLYVDYLNKTDCCRRFPWLIDPPFPYKKAVDLQKTHWRQAP